MRILLLNHYYWPDFSGNAQYGTQLAEDLAAAGAEVHAIASRGDYLGERKAPLPAEEVHNGVYIHRVPVTNFGKRKAWQRLGDALSFHTTAFFRAMRLPRPDVIISQTAPLMMVTTAYALSRLKGARLLVWCQDIWPDIAFALNLFRRKSVSGRIFRGISHWSMRRADLVIAIGRCMESYLRTKLRIPSERIVLQQNWGDSLAIRKTPQTENGYRKKMGLAGKFVVLYSGNMGWGHPFESIMEVVRRLREAEHIRFLFIGGGQRKPYIEEFLTVNSLHNAVLLPYEPSENLSETLSAGNVHLISLDPRLDGLIVPSKLYGAMAAARPVIFLGSDRNEISTVLAECGCGMRLDPGDADALQALIAGAAENPQVWADMGERGYSEYREKYSRERATGRYAELLRQAVGD